MRTQRICRILGALAALAIAGRLLAPDADAQAYSYRNYGHAFTPASPVDLRAGPSTGAAVVGVLRPGMPLTAGATTPYGWMQVNSPVGIGWAYGSYLAPGPISQ